MLFRKLPVCLFLMDLDVSSPVAWGLLITGLLGGLALFLFGMNKMSEGLKHSAGGSLRKIISSLTHTRIGGLFTGALATTVIQSSSATTVMLISFVQAGLISFSQSLGVILGADIGTTITAQLIAFRLTDYSLALVAAGFLIVYIAKSSGFRHIGEAIFGFGVLFFGMKLMSDAMEPLHSYPSFIGIIEGLENPLLGLLAGTLLTALIQSSSAFIGIIIVLAQQGFLTLEAGIPLIFGANVGTCITAGLASIGATREARRVALGHVLFKVAGVLVFIAWIPQFADIIRTISPSSELSGLEKVAGDTPRQIANAHTLFNVTIALVFLPFTGLFQRLILKIIPHREIITPTWPKVWHLDETKVSTPALALDLARAEIARMTIIVERMFREVMVPFTGRNGKDDTSTGGGNTRHIEWREKKTDFLQEKITGYLLKISNQQLTPGQSSEIFALITTTKYLESIADVIKKNMLPLVNKKQETGIDFSEEGKRELAIYHEKVSKQLNRLKRVFSEKNISRAQKILDKEISYAELEKELDEQHLQRFTKQYEKTVVSHELHMDVMENLKQVHRYAIEMARALIASKRENGATPGEGAGP